MSPYQLHYQLSVDNSCFRVFGCLCYASTLLSHRTKFSPRAVACVFLGYSPGMKGYKLYNIATKQFFVSRDVVFHENVFPFHNNDSSHDMVDPFPNLVIP